MIILWAILLLWNGVMMKRWIDISSNVIIDNTRDTVAHIFILIHLALILVCVWQGANSL